MKITDEMRKQLRQPLPAESLSPIITKPHLTSVKPIFVIERLNDVFGVGAWQLKTELLNPISSEQKVSSKGRAYTEYTAVVKVIFTIPTYDIYLECIAGSTNEDEGDSAKGGISDCITKIASWLEIGIDVYKGNKNIPSEKTFRQVWDSCKSKLSVDKARETIKYLPQVKTDRQDFISQFKKEWESLKPKYADNNALPVWDEIYLKLLETK